MKFASAALIVFAAFFLIAADNSSVEPRGLTVHEWGTFTSVAGEDGSSTDWDALGCASDLPAFVNDFGYRNFKWRLTGTVRMETPVIYFYSQREMQATVKVQFPQGVITEWYPRAEHGIYQKKSDGSVRRLDTNLFGIDTSLRGLTGAIEWKNVNVRPGAAPALPLDPVPNHYYAARKTDAAPVTVGDQHEKFLFYRGVGRFPIPISARVSGDGKIVIRNLGQEPVPAVFLFENRAGRLGYRDLSGFKDDMTMASPSLDGSFEQLRNGLEKAMVAQGLFPKEAQAMVETWRDSWFEEGARLIYVLPSHAVDEILPLQIEPKPVQTSRVFVGRIELLTPAITRSVEDAIAKGDWSTIHRYNRFLDPILKRISSGDSAKQSSMNQFRQDSQRSGLLGNCR